MRSLQSFSKRKSQVRSQSGNLNQRATNAPLKAAGWRSVRSFRGSYMSRRSMNQNQNTRVKLATRNLNIRQICSSIVKHAQKTSESLCHLYMKNHLMRFLHVSLSNKRSMSPPRRTKFKIKTHNQHLKTSNQMISRCKRMSQCNWQTRLPQVTLV